MKNYRFPLLFLLLSVCCLSAARMPSARPTEDSEKNEKREKIKERLKSRHFVVEINRAIPMGAGIRQLTSAYRIKITGDSIDSYLPFFGRAYSVPYDGGKGLIFQAPLSDYKLSFNKKGTATIKFKTETDEDSFTYTLQIQPDGAASVRVIPVNRQSISFYGRLAEPEEE